MIDLLGAALRYAARGWPVLPLASPVVVDGRTRCSCGLIDCRRVGKHPDGRLARHGVSDATTRAAQIEAWWKVCPGANVGVALGGHNTGGGAWAVDVDPKNGGDQTLVDLVLERGPLGPTLHAETGSGGDHYFFRWPSTGRITGAAHRLGPGLDVQAAGQYVVAAPSLHESGARYRWDDEGAELLAAPAWLLELVLPAPASPAPPPRPAPRFEPRRIDVDARAAAYIDALPPAIQGQGGDRQTTRAAHALVMGFGLPQSRALDLLLGRYNPRCLPPWSAKALERKIAYVARTSASEPGFLLRAS